MRKILLFISFFVSLIAFAGEVTEQEALQKAQQFMKGKQFKQKNLRRAAALGGKSFYVFNAEQNGGFVIVSADDRTEAILGYADQGTLDANRLPENAKKWLEGYEIQISALENCPHEYTSERRVLGAPVAPMITAHWGQGAPYNNMCPMDGDERSVTGCTATAMAQVMHYYKWPITPVGPLPAYTTSTKKIEVEALPATSFKWDKMKVKYNRDETGESADAVAELMRFCGQSVEMNYKSSSSGANVWASHMIDIFGYSKTAQDVRRQYYNTKDWEALIYQEMKEKRPVLYCAFSGDGGHEFIIDGYDDKGLFHVNWGWNGSSDGYFVLSVLNPNDRGIGGGTSANGYTLSQRALIGIQPDNGEDPGRQLPRVECQSEFTTATYTRTGAENFVVNVTGKIITWPEDQNDVTVDFRWVLCQDENILGAFDTTSGITLKYSYFYNVSATLSLGATLADGVYELRGMYRANSSDSWKFCDLFYKTKSFILMTISGNTLTLNQSADMPDIIHINSVNLQGAKKTMRGMTATMNWKYNGYLNVNTFYLWDGGKDPIATVSSYLNHNQTEDLDIHFSPSTAGNITYELSTDDKKTNVIWTSEPQTIEASLKHTLSGKIEIEGEKNKTIEGTTINATITLKNDGTNAYNDQIVIELIPIAEESYDIVGDSKTIYKDVSLAAGEEKPLTVQFADLTKGQRYEIDAYYYSLSDKGNRVNMKYATWTTCTVGTVLVAHNMDVTIAVKNANSNNEIEGTSIKMDITLQNKGTNDYKDKILVRAWYDNPEKEGYIKSDQSQKFDADIPAGQTKTISNYEFKDLKIGEGYYVSVSYYSEKEEQRKYLWTKYTMIEPKGYVPGDANGDGVVNVSDIVLTVNYIMGNSAPGFNKEAADLNGDGQINVTDIVMMVNIIMETAAREAEE